MSTSHQIEVRCIGPAAPFAPTGIISQDSTPRMKLGLRSAYLNHTNGHFRKGTKGNVPHIHLEMRFGMGVACGDDIDKGCVPIGTGEPIVLGEIAIVLMLP